MTASTLKELTARTHAGANLVALAEWLADDSHQSIDALREAGYFAAPIPEELGGLGVESVHDLVVASGRLARGDTSLAIGVNTHLVAVVALVRRWRIARAGGNARRERALAASLEAIASDEAVIAVPYLDRDLLSGLFHASVSLGIAEDALARVADPELAAESAIDLAAARSVLSRAAALVDAHYAEHPHGGASDEATTSVLSEGQAAKTFVSDLATRVVDRTLALSGGAGHRLHG